MSCTAAVEADLRRRALDAVMWSLTASRTSSTLTAGGASMPETLTLVTSKRIEDENPNVLTEPSDIDLFRQSCGFKGENQQAGVSPLVIPEGCEPPNVIRSIYSKVSQYLVLRQVAEFWSEDGTLTRVPTLMK